MTADFAGADQPRRRSHDAGLATVAREWGRIGVLGFGGPPAHISLLRELCVRRRGWLPAGEFERALGAVSLLPGPASTQLAILCAWRVRGAVGAVVGGLSFIVPGLVVILALSALFLAGSPPAWVRGAGAGAGAAVPAVALRAGLDLAGPLWRRARSRRVRVALYAVAGAAAAAAVGAWVILVLVGCGTAELALASRAGRSGRLGAAWWWPPLALTGGGGLLPLVWTALKVGALSFGGGFVIVPLMQSDAVNVNHWMSGGQFLDAVALGQVTPGPVVLTVAAVGFAAGGVGAALLATLVAFLPSFVFVLAGAARYEQLAGGAWAGHFLAGAAPAAAGTIVGAALPLARALGEPWQAAVLAASLVLLVIARRGVIGVLVLAGAAGALAGALGASLPR